MYTPPVIPSSNAAPLWWSHIIFFLFNQAPNTSVTISTKSPLAMARPATVSSPSFPTLASISASVVSFMPFVLEGGPGGAGILCHSTDVASIHPLFLDCVPFFSLPTEPSPPLPSRMASFVEFSKSLPQLHCCCSNKFLSSSSSSFETGAVGST